MKKILLSAALGATLLLGGCVAVPYDSPYAYDGSPYPYYTGAPYVTPSVSIGVGYSDFGHRGWGGGHRGGWGHGGHGGGWGGRH